MSPPRSVAIVGAGLAGLVAAIEASAAGAHVQVFERGDEPGGTTAASAGWIWRYRDIVLARACAPHGDAGVHAAVVEALDGDLAWLEEQGVSFLARETGRPHTVGVRVDAARVVATLVDQLDAADAHALCLRSEVVDARRSASGAIELRIEQRRYGAPGVAPTPWRAFDAVVFAGGGYAGDLDRIAAEAGASDEARAAWLLRAPDPGRGSSIDAALRLGAQRVPATGESLVRLVPTGPRIEAGRDQAALVRMGELQVPGSTVSDRAGRRIEQAPHDWAGAMVAWELARTDGAGTLAFDMDARRTRLPAGGTVEDAIRDAVGHGASARHLDGGRVELAVRAGITATRCGLHVDGSGHLLTRERGHLVPLAGAFAAGIDAADPARGGIASGLALALVLGRRAGRGAAACQAP